MKQVRLLPIVIFAALALLMFKGIGIVTQGGYVLVGTGESVAAGGGGGHGEAPAEGADAAGEITIAPEPTMADDSVTLTDAAPTMTVGEKSAGGHGETPAAEGGEAPAGHGETPAAEHGEAAATEEPAPAAEGHGETAKAEDDGCVITPATEGSGEDGSGEMQVGCPPVVDGTPMTEDDIGNRIPLVGEDGGSLTEAALLQRLSERRDSIDALASELATREALVQAAEKRLEERSAVLAEMESRITSMADQQKAAEEDQFKTMVSMYEQMKPAEAAAILNALDMNVLVRVTRTMNPRKMSAILAKLDPKVAQGLTMQLAAVAPLPDPVLPGQDVAALPQIVGQ